MCNSEFCVNHHCIIKTNNNTPALFNWDFSNICVIKMGVTDGYDTLKDFQTFISNNKQD